MAYRSEQVTGLRKASLPTVPTFNSCTKCVASPGIIHVRTPNCIPFSWVLMPLKTSQLHVALIHKLRGSLLYLAYLLDMISTGFCTTRHWQTSGRLVQELNSVLHYCHLLSTGSTAGAPDDAMSQHTPRRDGCPVKGSI